MHYVEHVTYPNKKYDTLEEFVDSFNKTYDYRSIMEYDYDYYMECKDGYGYCEPGCCKCGKVIDIVIKKLQYTEIINKISKLSLIDQYIIDRLLSYYDFSNVTNFTPIVSKGYCGEEFDAIQLNEPIKDILYKHLSNLISLSDINKILYVLNIEYDIPATSLQNYSNAIVKSIPINHIMFNPAFFNKYEYNDYFLPRGICIQNKDLTYLIIDGHNRISQDIRHEKTEINIILLS
jgi:hypothetical protein